MFAYPRRDTASRPRYGAAPPPSFASADRSTDAPTDFGELCTVTAPCLLLIPCLLVDLRLTLQALPLPANQGLARS